METSGQSPLSRRSGRRALACAVLAGWVAALAAQAQIAAPTPFVDEIDFDIPAEPLDAALTEFAQASGVDILYVKGLAKGRTSTALKGRYTEAAALQTLLRGAGLSVRFTGRKAAFIFLANGPAPTGGRAGDQTLPSLRLDMAQVRAPIMIGNRRSEFDAYAQGAVGEIYRMLREDRAVRGDRFQALLAVVIAEDGRINKVIVKRTSGDANRDGAIRHALTGRLLPKPPPGLAQSLQFTIDWVPTFAAG